MKTFFVDEIFQFLSAAIVVRVQGRENPPFRPVIPNSYNDSFFVRMMRSCWDEDPVIRPKFSDILQTIKKINNGK